MDKSRSNKMSAPRCPARAKCASTGPHPAPALPLALAARSACTTPCPRGHCLALPAPRKALCECGLRRRRLRRKRRGPATSQRRSRRGSIQQRTVRTKRQSSSPEMRRCAAHRSRALAYCDSTACLSSPRAERWHASGRITSQNTLRLHAPAPQPPERRTSPRKDQARAANSQCACQAGSVASGGALSRARSTWHELDRHLRTPTCRARAEVVGALAFVKIGRRT